MHLTAPEQGNLNRLIGDSSVTVNDENALMLIDRTIIGLRDQLQRALAREKKNMSVFSGAALDRYVDDRGDIYNLTAVQSKQLQIETRQRAKTMSLANRGPTAAEERTDRLIEEHNKSATVSSGIAI